MKFGKKHKTSYGLEFLVITKEEWDKLKPETYKLGWSDYDRQQVHLHILNCGFGILDTEYQKPIDNEYDLDAIYNMVIEKTQNK